MEGVSNDDQMAEPRKKRRHSQCIFSSSQASRLSSAERSKILEDRLARVRAYLEQVQSKLPLSARCDIDELLSLSPGPAPMTSAFSKPRQEDERNAKLENMVGNQGRMSSLDHRKAEFYGGFSGFAFIHKTKQFFDEENGYHSDTDSETTQSAITHLFDSPLPDRQALDVDVPVSRLLPSRRTASELLRVVFDRVYPLFDFLHEPTFQEQTNRIYEQEPIEFDDSDHDFLPLFYVVIGLGFLFSHEKHRQYGCGAADATFHRCSKQVDISRCRNLLALQALIGFVLFLMSTGRLATSHTYIGLAVTSAMRLGLSSHSTHTESMPELERDLRRRVFYTIVKLDIYTAQVLGLPTLTNIQELREADPAKGAEEVLHLKSQSSPEVFSAISAATSAKHLELLVIIHNMVKRVFPRPNAAIAGEVGRRVLLIKISEVVEAQRELKQWRESLQEFFSFEHENSVLAKCAERVEVANNIEANTLFGSLSHELEMVHNFGYILLYRPFLHYLARARSDDPPDKRQLRCALACIQVAERTIIRSKFMLQSGSLSPSSWHSLYTIFLSVVSLIFFLGTQPDAKESVKVHHVAESGVRILASTACQDVGSQRCLDVLRVLARRLSHLVMLDIDKIQSNAESLCQGDGSESKERNDAATQQTENDVAAIPGFDRGVETSTGDSVDSGDISRELMTSCSSQAYGDSGESLQTLPYDKLFNPFSTSLEQDNVGQSLFAAQMDVSQPPAYPSSATMEVPYAEAFSWPFQTRATSYTSFQAATDQQQMEMHDAHGPLTANDVVAFMHINPGEDPFA